MRLRLTILGFEVFCLEQILDEPEYLPGIGAGSTHNFERLPEDFDGEDFGFR